MKQTRYLLVIPALALMLSGQALAHGSTSLTTSVGCEGHIKSRGHFGHRGGHMGFNFNVRARGDGEVFRLIPEDVREDIRENRKEEWEVLKEEWKDMTPEERQAKILELRAEFKANKEARKAQGEARAEAFTELTGLEGKHEIKAALREEGAVGEAIVENGNTVEDAAVFLTEDTNARVDVIVEKHELNEEQEQSIRDRIGELVQRILNWWFGADMTVTVEQE